MTADAVTFRPRRVRLLAIPLAVVLVAVFAVIGTLLRVTPTGAYFRVSDQIAMVLVGVLLACGVLLLTRPRVRADADGIEVRNLLGTTFYPWTVVRAIRVPDGSAWGRLELPADEYVSLMALQVVDGDRAVHAVRSLRALLKAANVTPS
ncbi:MAG: PH domain-containing protein [Kutzneria sp.]|nr:PH domain-containing protein [Kutzneria sp.]